MDDKTRNSLIKLAYERRELRPVILPLLKEGQVDGSFERTLHVENLTPIDNGTYQIEGAVKLAANGETVLEQSFTGTVALNTASITYNPGSKKASDAFFEMVVSDLVSKHHASIFALAMNS